MRDAKPATHFRNGQFVGNAVIGQLHDPQCAPDARAGQAHFCALRRGPLGAVNYGAGMAGKPDIGPYQAHLRAWREIRGLTLEAVGERLRVEHTTVGRWERGELPISSKWLVALSHLYEVHPRDLLASPSEAAVAARIAEIGELIPDMNDEAFEHLRFFARNVARRQ